MARSTKNEPQFFLPCPGCGKKLIVSEDDVGSVVKCKNCLSTVPCNPPLQRLNGIWGSLHPGESPVFFLIVIVAAAVLIYALHLFHDHHEQGPYEVAVSIEWLIVGGVFGSIALHEVFKVVDKWFHRDKEDHSLFGLAIHLFAIFFSALLIGAGSLFLLFVAGKMFDIPAPRDEHGQHAGHTDHEDSGLGVIMPTFGKQPAALLGNRKTGQ